MVELALFAEQDVGALQIAVDNLLIVEVILHTAKLTRRQRKGKAFRYV